MDILLFKTNIENPERIRQASRVLENISGIQKWNIDISDCDNVLRIESMELSSKSIKYILQKAGYFCEELLD